MKKGVIVIISIVLVAILWLGGYFFVKNRLKVEKNNEERIYNIEQKIDNLSKQINKLTSNKIVLEMYATPLLSIEETKSLFIEKNQEKQSDEPVILVSNKIPTQNIVTKNDDSQSITPEIMEIGTITTKKIGYINKTYEDGSIAKISFDEIVILPKEQCEGLEICFKNENKKIVTFILADTVEIYSYFLNYLVSGEIRKTKKILLPCFLEFFAEDDADDYTRFNKIPYWITLEDNIVTKIEEQTVVGLYE